MGNANYELILSDDFNEHIEKHKKSGQIKIILKIATLLEELTEHPYTGTGKPEPLSYDKKGKWSRRINRKHRLIYQVNDTTIIVSVLSASDIIMTNNLCIDIF
jgi:toxin YoeB